MSGSVALGGLVLSLFTSGYGTSDSSNLLSVRYPAAGSSTASGDPVAALKHAETDSTREIAQTAAQPAHGP